MTTTIKTGFDEYIANAANPDHRNYSPALARRIKAEKRIAAALVEGSLKRGYAISVNDGEEWVVRRSTDKVEIMASMFSTDEDYIHLRTASGEKVGYFYLVYGNCGHDVVSDSSANEVCDAIWQEIITPLADKIEAEG